MKIILHNPQSIWYKLTLGNLISGKSYWRGKYEYFFDHLYLNQELIYVYLDIGKKNNFLQKFKLYIKFLIWVKINKLKINKFRIIYKINNLTKNDILLTFIHLNFSSVKEKNEMKFINLSNSLNASSAYKVVNLSHYGYNASISSENLKNAEIDLFISENNLYKNSKFFKYYFNWYTKEVYNLPFIPQKRFVKNKNFDKRKNIALAIGSITLPIEDSSFKSFFHHNELQPMRHELYNKRNQNKKYYDSYISPILKKNIITLTSFQKIISYVKSFKTVASYVINLEKTSSKLDIDRSYFKFDMVDKFNDYKMFICPEEIIDLPAVGFVEGMACGSAFIGIKNSMYKDLGMIDKVNYIAYDGSFDDLMIKINYYQNHPIELEEIAENGRKFIEINFNSEKVIKDLLNLFKNKLNQKLT